MTAPSRQKLTQNAFALYEAITEAHERLDVATGVGDVAQVLKILANAKELVAAPPEPRFSFKMTRRCALLVQAHLEESQSLRGYLNDLTINDHRCYLRVTRAKVVLRDLDLMFNALANASGKTKVKNAFLRLAQEARIAEETAPAALELLAYESD